MPADSRPSSLSEGFRAVKHEASSALAVAAQENPLLGSGYSLLVSGYSQWESALRSEAQSRLQLASAASEEVLHGRGFPRMGFLPGSMSGSSLNLGSAMSSAMKRSASDNSIIALGPAARKGKPSMEGGGFGYTPSGEASMFGPRGLTVRMSGSGAMFLPSEQQALRLGIPQGLTPGGAGSLGGGAPAIGALEAVRNIEAFLDTSRKAIRSAQQSIAETATNCQQNLSALTTLITHNVANNSKLQQNAKDAVTWSIATSADPLSGALVPWTVFPRHMRSGSHDQDLTLTTTGEASFGGGGGGAATAAAAETSPPQDWITPFEQYMHELDDARQGVTKKRRSLREPGRKVAIVTTASLPWLTGTSVNPLLRAAYLSTDGSRSVTLVLPWLSMQDQERVFPFNTRFDTPESQEAYVREWARKRTGLDCNFNISFYPGRYAAEKGSILPVGDITQVIPDSEADVAVLEEPEHLSWYHHGRRWTDKFNHVVGVMHTNYLDYARREEGGHIKELVLKHINAWVCRIHCHKVVKLSDAVQKLPREETMFVHGVSPSFIKVGERKAEQMQQGTPEQAWSKGVYFIGKVLWAKGYTELLQRMSEHTTRTGQRVHVDVFGSGPDLKAVEEEAARRQLDLSFNGARDHADQALQDYKVFVNPSLSDVVATTTAEALAMGKWVVCADHPSNRFFARFPNCLVYRDANEFSHCLHTALSHSPKPLGPEELKELTWEAATERFLDVADLKNGQPPLEVALDTVLHAAHNTLTGIEFMRQLAGAGTKTRDLPLSLVDYTPSNDDVGGFFDNHARARKAQPQSLVQQQK